MQRHPKSLSEKHLLEGHMNNNNNNNKNEHK
jgi:hypothetical protein